MDENSNKETYFFDQYSPLNYNLYQFDSSNRNNVGKNLWLKYHYKFIISIIIFFLSMTGYLITYKGLFDMPDLAIYSILLLYKVYQISLITKEKSLVQNY